MAEEGYRVIVRSQKVSPVTLTKANLGLIVVPYLGSIKARAGREVKFLVNKNLAKTAAVMADGSASAILEDVPLVPPPIISVEVEGTPIQDQVLDIALPSPEPRLDVRMDSVEDEGAVWKVFVGVEVRDKKGCGMEADYVLTASWDGDFRETYRRTEMEGRDVAEVALPKGFRRARVKVRLDNLDFERELTVKEPTPSPTSAQESWMFFWVALGGVAVAALLSLPWMLGD